MKSTIRHPKFGVRSSKFRKPLALEEVGAEAGSILLAYHEQEQPIFQYSIGDKPVPHDTVIAWGKGISGAVFQSGEARITNQVDQDATHLHFIDQTTGFVTRDKGDKGVRGVRGYARQAGRARRSAS